jgi:hypothetical protein
MTIPWRCLSLGSMPRCGGLSLFFVLQSQGAFLHHLFAPTFILALPRCVVSELDI